MFTLFGFWGDEFNTWYYFPQASCCSPKDIKASHSLWVFMFSVIPTLAAEDSIAPFKEINFLEMDMATSLFSSWTEKSGCLTPAKR